MEMQKVFGVRILPIPVPVGYKFLIPSPPENPKDS